MKEDTKQILENMEKELMREALREEQEAGPAFEDPDVLETGPEPEVYSNFANDYGKELTRFAESGGELQEEKEEFNDGWRIFDRFSDLPVEQWPRDNSLRRAFAEFVEAGGKTGHGFGVILFDKGKIIR